MLDGLGMAETTPGPLIMVLQFVGFMAAFRAPGGVDPLLAATLAAMLATWVTFVPCFLRIFLGAPFIERLRGNAAISGGMAAITAAVVGVIVNLAVWFGLHVLFREVGSHQFGPVSLDLPVPVSVDWPSVVLTLAAFIAIFRLKMGAMPVLLGCAGLGMVWTLLGMWCGGMMHGRQPSCTRCALSVGGEIDAGLRRGYLDAQRQEIADDGEHAKGDDAHGKADTESGVLLLFKAMFSHVFSPSRRGPAVRGPIEG